MGPSAFATEAILQNFVAASLVPTSRSETCYAVAREVHWGPRIVDVVLASFPEVASTSFPVAPAALARTNILQTFVLAALASRRRATPGLLARLLHVPEADIRASALRFLLRQELVEPVGAGCFALTAWGQSLPGELVAVETKLTDWRGALVQANDYTRVADSSYIALPYSLATDVAAHRQCLASAGVGLIAVQTSGDLSTIVPSRRQARRRWDLVPWVEKVSILRDLTNRTDRWQFAKGE